jgi:hypothetical protein
MDFYRVTKRGAHETEAMQAFVATLVKALPALRIAAPEGSASEPLAQELREGIGNHRQLPPAQARQHQFAARKAAVLDVARHDVAVFGGADGHLERDGRASYRQPRRNSKLLLSTMALMRVELRARKRSSSWRPPVSRLGSTTG